MNLNFIFKSYDHLRYENGNHASGPHGGAFRAIKVESNFSLESGYTVTIYNLEDDSSNWQNNIQMAPKRMNLIEHTKDKIVLRGFGHDIAGYKFSDHGLSIYLKDDFVVKCILHMYDRNIDIEYLSKQDDQPSISSPIKDDFETFLDFIVAWKNKMPRELKYSIAKKTDELNNIGVDLYEIGDIENAINFYNQALLVMPINDDALKNLKVCYSKINNIEKYNEVKRKLDYLNKLM